VQIDQRSNVTRSRDEGTVGGLTISETGTIAPYARRVEQVVPNRFTCWLKAFVRLEKSARCHVVPACGVFVAGVQG
jgi:hypothetical protein